jgi:hypothetical protein
MLFNDPRYQPGELDPEPDASSVTTLGYRLAWPPRLGPMTDGTSPISTAPARGLTGAGLGSTERALLRLVGFGAPQQQSPRLGWWSLEPGGAYQVFPPGGKLSTDNTPMLFQDVLGTPLIGRDGLPMMIPRGVDPLFFVNRGLADAAAGPRAVFDGLRKFGQGRDWALQRQGPDNAVIPGFRDAATVALGLYGSAAGLDPHHLLTMQALYALANSDFGDAIRNREYYPLPEINVRNTMLGYQLHRSGRIGPMLTTP